MRKFTNPLDNIRVASPCTANWDEMYGDDRKRFCGECKLNVYNLSGINRQEAENLLLNSEGRLCVRFFRRSDGTVLTKDCPVGWQAVKAKAARAVTAAFAVAFGIITGITSMWAAESIISIMPMGEVNAPESNIPEPDKPVEIRGRIAQTISQGPGSMEFTVGKPVLIRQMGTEKDIVPVR